MAEAVGALAAATEHERTHDLAAAALALEAVPQSLRGVVLPGARETVAAALSRIDAALTEIRRLEAMIRARPATPADEGLLPDVERLFALKPNSPGLHELRDELLVRRRQREQQWAEAVAQATERLEDAKHEAAIAILSAVPGAPTVEALRLRARIEQMVQRARGLAAAIRGAVKAGRLEGLRELVEAYRKLEPADAEAIKLERALVARDGKLAAAAELEKACRFTEAAHVFDAIAGWRVDVAAAEGSRRCRQAADERAKAMAAVAAARPGACAEAIAGTAGYQRLLAATGATDAEFAAALRGVELARAEDESRARRTRSLVVAGGVLAATVAVAAVGLGVRSSMRAATLARASRAESIAALPPSVICRFPPLVNSIGMELKLLPAGAFTMGEPPGDGAEKPQRVTLKKPFCMGVSEVTNAQWERVMGSPPSRSKAADHPVENVSWDDAVEFCKRLSALPEERRAGRTYRLPTESEWEYACRAGTTTAYSFGDDEAALGDHGWFAENAGNGTHPVGMKQANPWGLVDMHGNVWEWCSGLYGGDERDAARAPQDPAAGPLRGYRGGGWSGSAAYCRSPARLLYDPASRFDFLGFRVALGASAAVLLEAAEAR
jgi:formylglycine-generating enzyme required for sulfatase activity